MKSIQFWLVRHGQTEENVKRILCGQQGGTLTQLGIKQAESLGKRLSSEKFDQIYVSDLSRTRHTFDCIQKFQPSKNNVEYTRLIMEKSAGSLDGQSLEVPKVLAAQQKIPFREFRPDQGEAWVDVMERSKQFIILMVNKHILQQEKVQAEDTQVQEQQQQQQQQKPPLKIILKHPLHTTNNLQIAAQSFPLQIQRSSKDKESIPTKKQKNQVIRILGVSHGGFIMEIINFVRLLMDKKEPVYTNDSVNCSITIFEITLKSQPINSENILECLDIRIVLRNDNKHCKHIK